MLQPTDHLSIGLLFRRFWGRIGITWTLTFVETALFALLPLLIGWSIDGLLAGDNQAFLQFCITLAALLVVSIGRRVYDTRAYGTIRAELGRAQFQKTEGQAISKSNARVLMGRELVDFLETEAPQAMTAIVRVTATVVILWMFNAYLSFAAAGAAIIMLAVFWAASGRFFRLNGALNAQTEQQVAVLDSRNLKDIVKHFTRLRQHEVRLSDWESIIYGVIFAVLLSMLAFNLWYGATQIGATTGQIFAIVSYSADFVEAAVALPYTLQAMTRLKEITQRINLAEDEEQD
ncbi:MAG: ABC transporter six-transmembrane domain-containing protein [Pseudomonadota bacterium]